jgi:hypothetical protein
MKKFVWTSFYCGSKSFTTPVVKLKACTTGVSLERSKGPSYPRRQAARVNIPVTVTHQSVVLPHFSLTV